MSAAKKPTAAAVEPLPGLAPWHGGKRHLPRRLAALLDADRHTCFVDVFAGMGGVFFGRAKRRKVEIINDANGDLVTLYRVTQRHLPALLEAIAAMPAARTEFDRLLDIRACDLTDVERAARLLFLQRMKWAGDQRKRHFLSNRQTAKVLTEEAWRRRLTRARDRLVGVTIEHLDFEACIRRFAGPETVFYLDPPYWGFETIYGKGIFARSDFARLATVLRQTRSRFLFSINDVPEIRDMFGGWARLGEVQTIYTAHDGGRKDVTELLIAGGPRPMVNDGPL